MDIPIITGVLMTRRRRRLDRLSNVCKPRRGFTDAKNSRLLVSDRISGPASVIGPLSVCSSVCLQNNSKQK